MENVKKVSLITTLFNESDNINRFLESYKNQTKYADEFIIVDGGSTDETAVLIENFAKENLALNINLIIDKSCSKKFVDGPIAKGRNKAIRESKYDYIAATDAGCILDKKWFEEIVKPFKNSNIDVVSGWYEASLGNDFQILYADIYLPKLKNINLETFLPSSRSIAFKKSCWENVSGYPENSLTAEDTKFDLDMKKIGCDFIFTSKAIVYWDCPRSYEEAIDKASYYAQGDGKFRLHFKKFILRNIFLFFPINILLSKNRRKNFKLAYGVMFSYQFGYIKGLLS